MGFYWNHIVWVGYLVLAKTPIPDHPQIQRLDDDLYAVFILGEFQELGERFYPAPPKSTPPLFSCEAVEQLNTLLASTTISKRYPGPPMQFVFEISSSTLEWPASTHMHVVSSQSLPLSTTRPPHVCLLTTIIPNNK